MPTPRSHLNRRCFLKAVGAGAAAAAIMPLSSLAQQVSGDKKPNFVFIFLDDAGWGDFKCYGNRSVYTPNVDKMAKEGTLFTQFYVNAGVCAPSRIAFMTGQFPGRLGVHHVQWGNQEKYGMPLAIDPSVPMITQVLHDAGYRTGHFGKWHLSHIRDTPSPSEYGIDDHRTLVSTGPGWERPDNDFIAQSEKLVFDEGIRFIEENKDKPFYLNIWGKRPHTPIAPSEEQMNVGPYKTWKARGFGSEPIRFETPHRQYYATITEIDTQIGRFMEKLAELGLDENTIVIFSSDNGPEHLSVRYNASVGSPGPFRGRKRSLYDGGVRVPFIVRWPGKVPANKINDTSVVSGVDWFPTVCHLAGVGVPKGAHMDGEDVVDIFQGADRDRKTPLLWEFRFPVVTHDYLDQSPMLAIREGKWKLLMNPHRSRVELYDMETGSMEVDSVADTHPEIVERLAAKLMEYHESLPEGPIDPNAGKMTYNMPKSAK